MLRYKNSLMSAIHEATHFLYESFTEGHGQSACMTDDRTCRRLVELLEPALPAGTVEAAASALRHLCARHAGASDLLIAGGAVPLVVRLLAHGMHHHQYVIIMVRLSIPPRPSAQNQCDQTASFWQAFALTIWKTHRSFAVEHDCGSYVAIGDSIARRSHPAADCQVQQRFIVRVDCTIIYHYC